MGWDAARREQVQIPLHKTASSTRPLGENLVKVVVHLEHDLEDLPDERLLHGFVEEIAHGVDEYTPGVTPEGGLMEAFRPDADGEGGESFLSRVHHRELAPIHVLQ
jgi:hypothetical protein